MGLTPKQEKFVQGLFSGLSQRQAYKQAYNAEKMLDATIDKKACELIKESKLSGRLRELQAEDTQNSKWTREKLIAEFEALKAKCMQEVPVLDRGGEPTGEYVFKEAGAVKALENIGKLLGMYVEKVEQTGDSTMTVNFNIPRPKKGKADGND
jgi:hypothetical protein